MRVIVTGGRTYDNYTRLSQVLDQIHQHGHRMTLKGGRDRLLLPPIEIIAHGACPYGGADELAGYWADANAVPVIPFPAARDRRGNLLGPHRNEYMVQSFRADLVVALPGGLGTIDCCNRAYRQGNNIYSVDWTFVPDRSNKYNDLPRIHQAAW